MSSFAYLAQETRVHCFINTIAPPPDSVQFVKTIVPVMRVPPATMPVKAIPQLYGRGTRVN